jgi:hypothetical protein
MGTKRWRGDAPAVAQVVTITLTAYDVTTIYSVTMNGKSVSVIGQGGTVNTTATALQTALAASTIPELAEVTWTVNTATITGTAKTAGTPFTATSSATGGTGTIGAVTTTTTSSGPNDWSVAANWDTGAVPVTGDDVYVENSASSILYGLLQSAVTLNSLHIRATFTGTIGLPRVNGTGTKAYFEYRTAYLTIGATTLNIGNGAGAGSGRVKINVGANQCTCNVYNTGSTAESNVPSFLFLGTHAANAMNVNKGNVGIANFAGEVATVATLQVGYVTNQAGDSTVYCGSGCTLTTIDCLGGATTINSNVTTATVLGGTLTVAGGTWTTLNAWGGKTFCKSTGVFATSNIGSGATLDCSQDMRAKTFTNVTINKGGSFLAPNDPRGASPEIVFTNPVQLSGCGLEDITLAVGKNYKVQVS